MDRSNPIYMTERARIDGEASASYSHIMSTEAPMISISGPNCIRNRGRLESYVL